MIQFTPAQLYKRITDEGIKNITWYEGYVANPKEMRHNFHRFKNEDVNAVLADAQNVLNQFPGLFTVLMYKSASGTNEPPTVIRVNGGNAQIAGPMQGFSGQTMTGRETEEEMYQRLLRQIKSEMEIQHLKEENARMKDRLNGLQTASGKLGLVSSEVIWNILKKSSPNLAKTMQGFEENEDTEQVQEKPKTKSQSNPKQDRERFQRSLDIIVETLGIETINKVADLLQKDPSKAELLKSFLT